MWNFVHQDKEGNWQGKLPATYETVIACGGKSWNDHLRKYCIQIHQAIFDKDENMWWRDNGGYCFSVAYYEVIGWMPMPQNHMDAIHKDRKLRA